MFGAFISSAAMFSVFMLLDALYLFCALGKTTALISMGICFPSRCTWCRSLLGVLLRIDSLRYSSIRVCFLVAIHRLLRFCRVLSDFLGLRGSGLVTRRSLRREGSALDSWAGRCVLGFSSMIIMICPRCLSYPMNRRLWRRRFILRLTEVAVMPEN
jgi:hypothetical protein